MTTIRSISRNPSRTPTRRQLRTCGISIYTLCLNFGRTANVFPYRVDLRIKSVNELAAPDTHFLDPCIGQFIFAGREQCKRHFLIRNANNLYISTVFKYESPHFRNFDCGRARVVVGVHWCVQPISVESNFVGPAMMTFEITEPD